MRKERRYHHRINTQLQAEVINRDNQSVSAIVSNVSQGGLTLEGDTAVLEHIELIDPETHEPFFPTEVDVIFSIPLDGQPVKTGMRCRMVNRSRLSQNAFRIGMVILDQFDGSEEGFIRFIDNNNG